MPPSAPRMPVGVILPSGGVVGVSLEPRPSPDQDSNEESRSYLLRLARLLPFLLPASWAVPGLGYAG